MSRLTDLIGRVSDPQLAADLRTEFDLLAARRSFGLNFERHVPEKIYLPGRRVRRYDKVMFRPAKGQQETLDPRVWTVTGFVGSGETRSARLVERGGGEDPEVTTRDVMDLVVVVEFRDPIYPGLRSTGRVEQGGDKLFHTVINGENFHVLEALTFVHDPLTDDQVGKVDCIYIDPPYNTRDRDWKYNNDYVDSDDAYRHSKWLAMMERRLRLARRLLNPLDSVLIVTIDEKEYLRLGLLLEQIFSDAKIQMISTVTNRKGVPRSREFSRVDEYIFFVYIGAAGPALATHDMLSDPRPSDAEEKVTWVGLRRRGSEWRREDRPGSFYPIFVDPETGQIVDVGSPLPLGQDRSTVPDRKGCLTVWPLNKGGAESRWQLAPDNVLDLLSKGYLRTRLQRGGAGVTMEYLSEGQRAQIEQGTIRVVGKDRNGAVIANHVGAKIQAAKTQWNLDSHGATAYGTQMVTALLPGRNFPYPKSLYAVEDALRFFVGDKPDAVVLDFFAGSGTTLHAVMRLNRQDGGRRRCICVTNNEVSDDEAQALTERGYRPGDPEWEALGICEQITKPRVEAAITGRTPEGEPLVGDYKFADEFPMADGFVENAEFFTLTYEDPERVKHGLGFEAIAPLLWLRAGAVGRRIEEPSETFEMAESYGILFNVDAAAAFIEAAHEHKPRLVFIVTDEERQYQIIADSLPSQVKALRLYESYLANCRINGGRD